MEKILDDAILKIGRNAFEKEKMIQYIKDFGGEKTFEELWKRKCIEMGDLTYKRYGLSPKGMSILYDVDEIGFEAKENKRKIEQKKYRVPNIISILGLFLSVVVPVYLNVDSSNQIQSLKNQIVNVDKRIDNIQKKEEILLVKLKGIDSVQIIYLKKYPLDK